MNHETGRKPLEDYLSLGYPITLVKEAEGGYTALIPDLPGCVSVGETVEEARRLWLEVAYERVEEIPLPRGIIQGEKEEKMNPYEAVRHNDLQTLKEWLEKHDDPNPADEDGDTPLHLAAIKGNQECVNTLLATGPDLSR